MEQIISRKEEIREFRQLIIDNKFEELRFKYGHAFFVEDLETMTIRDIKREYIPTLELCRKLTNLYLDNMELLDEDLDSNLFDLCFDMYVRLVLNLK